MTAPTVADRITQGNQAPRVDTPPIGHEAIALEPAFDSTAGRLAETESDRRRILGDLEHEVRNALASLEATTQADVDGAQPVEIVEMDALRDMAGTLHQCASDIAATSRTEERRLDPHPGLVDAAAAASEVVGAARARFATAGTRIDLDVDAAGGASIVRVDARLLRGVVANVLDHVLRRTLAGGMVRVGVGADPGGAVLEVAHTGERFDPPEAERTFEDLSRANSSSRTRTAAGSGVGGLTIARAIVEAHGGTITATRDEGETCASFRIRLPGAASPATAGPGRKRATVHLPSPRSDPSSSNLQSVPIRCTCC